MISFGLREQMSREHIRLADMVFQDLNLELAGTFHVEECVLRAYLDNSFRWSRQPGDGVAGFAGVFFGQPTSRIVFDTIPPDEELGIPALVVTDNLENYSMICVGAKQDLYGHSVFKYVSANTSEIARFIARYFQRP